jgi:hypothetical protein
MNMVRKKGSPSKLQRTDDPTFERRALTDGAATLKSAARPIARFNVPSSAGGGGGASLIDPPIVIQGGGSIDVDVPEKFKEKVSGKRGGKFKGETQNLVSIVIDGGSPIPLRPDSKIEINYE